jgi:hypothetical protein
MNIKTHRNNFLRRARMTTVLIAGIFLALMLHAHPTEQTVQSRFLFIFDTSSAMKSRVDAVQKALDTMLATSLSGQLHAGDSMGVWTFNQDLRPGDFPLQNWDPSDAVMIASNLTKFIGEQHYAKSGSFAALQSLLNRIVLGSERLTVVVFCDGETPISGTPFDAGINQAFQEKLAKQKSAHQPFVIVLRSQLGQYVNCTMGFPPQPVTFSEFPPLPEPPSPPAPKLTNAPASGLAPVVPSLIIVGTKVGSSLAQLTTAPTNLPPVTNQPPAIEPAPLPVAPPVAPIVPTNVPAAPVTNQTEAKIIVPAPGNPPAPPLKNSAIAGRGFLVIGAGLLVAAIALGIFMRLWLRRKDISLITRSMNDRR